MPIEKIHISETSTDKVPNSSSTGASVSTDMYGMAVKNCCDQIMERLKPFSEADPTAGWEKWVNCPESKSSWSNIINQDTACTLLSPAIVTFKKLANAGFFSILFRWKEPIWRESTYQPKASTRLQTSGLTGPWGKVTRTATFHSE